MIKTHMQPENSDENRRRELSEFLQNRRARLKPEEFGITSLKKRRVPGLKREEVAQLAGVSVSWYTWLEQGRPIVVSDQVVESIARALCLDNTEKTHLYLLAKEYIPGKKSGSLSAAALPPELQPLLDSFGIIPAYILDCYWNIIGWNESTAYVYAEYGKLSVAANHETSSRHGINLLWTLFTSAAQKEMLQDWDNEAKRCLAAFRAGIQPYSNEPVLREMIEKLKSLSSEFAAWWKEYDVMIPRTKSKILNHPLVGKLAFQTTTMTFPDFPQLKMMVYSPLDDETRKKLSILTDKMTG